jgi:uncharacterized protein YwgA
MAAANNRVVILGRLLKRLDRFNVASFTDRLIFQKTVYLLQAKGVFLGYSFNWYLHGPYSPVLARDGFELSTIYDGLYAYAFREPKIEASFEEFRKFIGSNGSNPDWLEAAASIHFLRKAFPFETRDQTIKRVMAKGAHLSKKLCEKVWAALVDSGLISSSPSN